MAPNRGPEHPELRRRVDAVLAETAGWASLTSSARSYDQQKALYAAYKAGRGNLAANPDKANAATGRKGSNHQVQDDGHSYAVDISVSPRTQANMGRLEQSANAHGLIRTVPSEYWHFELMAADGRAHVYGRDDLGAGAATASTSSGPGDSGSHVEHIQEILVGAGLLTDADVDGKLGPKTKAAIAEWQTRIGVTADGKWGPQTEAATTAALAALAPAGGPIATGDRPTLDRGDTGPEVAELQRALDRAGHGGKGVSSFDGDFGPSVERAVKAFQTAHGLVADGVVGPLTWAALG